jgi:hypothetical protein
MGAVLAALLRAEFRVLMPFGDGHPYDLAFERDGELSRVQCKTGRLIEAAKSARDSTGVIYFHTARHTRRGDGDLYRGYSEAEIDYFGVYCPQTSAVYLVPRKDVPAAAAHLRISPPRNGQTHGVRWAKDYLVS